MLMHSMMKAMNRITSQTIIGMFLALALTNSTDPNL